MSKLILYDWRCCDCDDVFEYMARSDVTEIQCPHCNGTAKRLISAPRIDPRLGCDPDGFPTMADKWARTREQKQRQEKQAREREGF